MGGRECLCGGVGVGLRLYRHGCMSILASKCMFHCFNQPADCSKL